ncbi:MAG: BON domain-containing protein [Curvibacter lanceolatus]|jgi:osmotically-inducible protein OsmY|uniref:BON domain-containing protein n=1 Tax=Curvibacter lanceolatus TaxID=86182 RepID=UPI0012F92752|nr:BON domain-containing protein [Curvibacter lanceolatus]MBV5291762.1 BON domain-containing protein [Curvibacter lanceolatus]
MNTRIAQSSKPDTGLIKATPQRTAQAILEALCNGYAVRPAQVWVTVTAHQARLVGEVDWKYQQQGATRCALATPGIHSVDNQLTLTPELAGAFLNRSAAAAPCDRQSTLAI